MASIFIYNVLMVMHIPVHIHILKGDKHFYTNYFDVGKEPCTSTCIWKMAEKKDKEYYTIFVVIRKDGSTFHVGIGQVKNGSLYLRYGSSSEKTTVN